MIKKVAVIADMHCGHLDGLTPPQYWLPESNNDAYLDRAAQFQREMWKFFSGTIKRNWPYDVLIVNGDCIDGKGEKSGGTELWSTDRIRQAECAAVCINSVKAKKVVMSHGTPYHVGKDEDWETVILDSIEAKEKSVIGHAWIDVNGVVFDVKHYVGKSQIPHLRYTPLAREKLQNMMWNYRSRQPDSEILIRSHVHYFVMCGDAYFRAFNTPCLQGYGSKFGERICSGTIDIGFLDFEIKGTKSWSWNEHIFDAPFLEIKPLKL